MTANERAGDGLARLEGRTAIVTGATGGLGYEVARGLLRLGASVVLAGRDRIKGQHALVRLSNERSAASPRFQHLDLASLASVRAFADATGACDILVNNAGLMGTPSRRSTADGFELQLGTNYLGHFALTGLLLPALTRAEGGGRVVSVSSVAHRRATIRFDDLQSDRAYGAMRAYGQSKLAMLVFAIELQRRAAAEGWNLRSVAAHPGWAVTDIIRNGEGSALRRRALAAGRLVFNTVAQSAAEGARPILIAAASATAEGGSYWGPGGRGEVKGAPTPARIMPQASDAVTGRRLWDVSERLTGVRFAAEAAA